MSNYNFFGASADPLLNPESIDRHIKQLEDLRLQLNQNPQQATTLKSVWDEISEELNSMTETQKGVLFRDKEYQQRDQEIAAIAAKYQLQLLMPYLLKDTEGKSALEKQLHLIRAKKDNIIKQERSEMEEFLRWKEQKQKTE